MTYFMPVSITAMACVSKISSMIQSFMTDVLPKGYLLVKNLYCGLPNSLSDLPLRINEELGDGRLSQSEEEESSPILESPVKDPVKVIPASNVADSFWNKEVSSVEAIEDSVRDPDVEEAKRLKKKSKKSDRKSSGSKASRNAIDDIFGSF
jgi:hypothetical protein